MMIKTLAAAALLASGAAHAVTITQWNFNSSPADSSTGTGSTAAAVGTGSASLVGGVTATFASGDASGGSSDPAIVDDSGWNLTTFAAQGTGSGTRGAQFLVSTAGYQDITVSYDLRHSNTSSAWEQVQVTTDGSTWTNVASFLGDKGDTWFNGRSVDLSAVTAADDNASFGIRVLSMFAPGTSSYLAASPTGSYGTAGTWRFDMVTISGTAITAAVPEPSTYAMLLAGILAIGFLVRERQRGGRR